MSQKPDGHDEEIIGRAKEMGVFDHFAKKPSSPDKPDRLTAEQLATIESAARSGHPKRSATFIPADVVVALVEMARSSLSAIEPPESPEWLEAWYTFVKDYNRYVNGDPKMPFSLLRDSIAAFMGNMDLALASKPPSHVAASTPIGLFDSSLNCGYVEQQESTEARLQSPRSSVSNGEVASPKAERSEPKTAQPEDTRHSFVPSSTAALTPEWCYEAFWRVNPGGNATVPSLYLLDFAREVLRVHGAPSATDTRCEKLLEQIVKGYVEWEDSGDSQPMVERINEADVLLNEIRTQRSVDRTHLEKS